MNDVEYRPAATARSFGALRAAALGLLLTAGLCGPAAAQQAPATQAQTPASQATPAASGQPPKSKNDPDRVICREEEAPTGSRLGGHKVCRTKREWDQAARDAQDMLDDFGRQEGAGGSPK